MIGASDGPTSIWLAGKEKERNPLRRLKTAYRNKKRRARRRRAERTITPGTHTLDEVEAYIKERYGAKEVPADDAVFIENRKNFRISMLMLYHPDLVGERPPKPDMGMLRALPEKERSDRLRAYMEACQSVQESAAALPESILPIDYHCYRIVPEDGSEIHIEMEKVHDFMTEGCSASCGPCRVGGLISRRKGKQKMKRAQAIMNDIVRYHGVSEKDIAEKNERYRGLLTSLTEMVCVFFLCLSLAGCGADEKEQETGGGAWESGQEAEGSEETQDKESDGSGEEDAQTQDAEGNGETQAGESSEADKEDAQTQDAEGNGETQDKESGGSGEEDAQTQDAEGNGETQAGESGEADKEDAQTQDAEGSGEDGVRESAEAYDTIYEAYYHKCGELAHRYGKPELVDYDEYDGIIGYSYAKGLCVVSLMDYDQDGTDDLFVVYANGNLSGTNMDDYVIPLAEDYEAEVWTYRVQEQEFERLLHLDRISAYETFLTPYWDAWDCFITVYENKKGCPVIQVCGYSGEDDTVLAYHNYYFADGAVCEDIYEYENRSYRVNGRETDIDSWYAGVDGYDTILLGAYLSSNGTTVDYTRTYDGVDLNWAIRHTSDVLSALKAGCEGRYPAVRASYIPIYMQELRRLATTEVYSDTEYESMRFTYVQYALYDMDHDGVPELIAETGEYEAAYMYLVYTLREGELVCCGSFGGSHSGLNADTENKRDGIVLYGGHMGGWWIEELRLSGTELESESVDDGYIDFSDESNVGKEYPELTSYEQYETYEYLGMANPATNILLYEYAVKSE